MEWPDNLPTLALLACFAAVVVLHPGRTLVVSAAAASAGKTSSAFLPVLRPPPPRSFVAGPRSSKAERGWVSWRCAGTGPLHELRSRDGDGGEGGDGDPLLPPPTRRRGGGIGGPRPYPPSDFADVDESADPLLRGRGYSVSDEAGRRGGDEEASKATTLSRIKSVPGAGVIRTTEEGGTGKLTDNWYLVPLSPPPPTPTIGGTEDGSRRGNGGDEASGGPALAAKGDGDDEPTPRYVMVDVPPFSDGLLSDVRSFLSGEWREEGDDGDDPGTGTSDNKSLAGGGDESTPAEGRKRHAQPVAIVITNRNSVHYSSAPAGTPYSSSRRSDLILWTEAFPGVPVVMHRYEVPRDMMGVDGPLTQTLDGNGPWAFDETAGEFYETGQKLVFLNWDDDKIAEVLGEAGGDGGNITAALREAAGRTADGDAGGGDAAAVDVRSNEEGARLLAVYAPGHTMGSVAMVFPEMGTCCSGNLIPQYEARPRLDGGGLVTTNMAGLGRQVESAIDLAATYCDRFRVVLPSRGDVMIVEGETAGEREEFLREVVGQFDKTARLYDDLGRADR